MRFAIYCRKSKYTGKGESVANQLDYCRRYVELTFSDSAPHELRPYLDEGYSGRDLERPAFRRMVRDCYAHLVDYVVVYRLDRVSRNVSDFARLYQELLDLGVGFVSTSERYDTSTSGGRAMLLMACVFAQLERETLSERVKDNVYALARLGRWLGGVAPTGYTSTPCYRGDRVSYRLSPNGDLATVECIFREYLRRRSLSAVVEYLHGSNVLSPRGNRYVASSVRTILENPVYCQSDADSYEYLRSIGCSVACSLEDCNLNGYTVYGRTSTCGGRLQRRMPASDWVVAVGEHPGVVSGGDWVSVQESLRSGSHRSHYVRNPTSLLSGILRCPLCHARMLTRTKRNGFVYACSNKLYHGTEACHSDSVDGSLDSMVVARLLSLTSPSADAIPLLESLKESLPTGAGATTDGSDGLSLPDGADPSSILVEGFDALPIEDKRRFVGSLVCTCEVLPDG